VPQPDALQVAVRALGHRDLSAAGVEARLARAGVGEAEREETLETLRRVGYLDDVRFAHKRAETLAGRGWGDAGIAADLERQGVGPELCAAALEGLEPERERARHVVAERGVSARTGRYLAGRGFGGEAIEAALIAEEQGAALG
jgi:SOS response regulatory protein OraA/RecX